MAGGEGESITGERKIKISGRNKASKKRRREMKRKRNEEKYTIEGGGQNYHLLSFEDDREMKHQRGM